MQFAKPSKETDPYLTLDCGQFQIMGKSIAGVETIFAIPQWNLTLDSGRAPLFAVHNDYLALTHWHLDHAGGLAHFLSLRCLNGLKPLHIIVPPEKKDQTDDFLNILKKTAESELSYITHASTENISLQKEMSLIGIPNFHCTPSTGYLITQTKNKLKKEFERFSEAEIIQAKKSGTTITNTITTPLLAFSGDSKGEFFTTEAIRAQYLLMECSFFEEEMNVQKIDDYGHTHIQDWKKYADKIESEVVIMTHTSQRYSHKEIEASCQKHLPKSLLDRLVVFR
ncbi:MAG: MBL fold metallo-hydrolase [Deltaproteobacteria bacterium]|nr:MAG: MBL fold metallo-hydrolase [Deltaproteobacteria bacterium]